MLSLVGSKRDQSVECASLAGSGADCIARIGGVSLAPGSADCFAMLVWVARQLEDHTRWTGPRQVLIKTIGPILWVCVRVSVCGPV